jgi:hypothetical protein
MPCTLGGAPVTMLRLLGLVKLGTTQSATSAVPRLGSPSVRAIHGMAPAATPWAMYSGSQPSTHTTTVGAFGSW